MLTPDATRDEAPSLDTADTPAPRSRPLRISWQGISVPERSASLLLLFLVIGATVLVFTLFTVHRRSVPELMSNSGAIRTNFSVNYWIDHGYFHSAGLLVRPASPSGIHLYVSSTGANLISGFLLEKVFKAVFGRTSLRLLALHNELVTLLGASLLALLAYRLARRLGGRPLHAFMLATATEVVHFTFPDNLAVYWEISGRQPFLVFALIFLLIEERCFDERTLRRGVMQGAAVFLMMLMEYAAGAAFLGSYAIVSALLSPRVPTRRILAIVVVPALSAMMLFGAQRAWASIHLADIPREGSTFRFRTGLDGSTQYYTSHLDIATGRDVARANFPPNQKQLFRWPWLFFAGVASCFAILVSCARGRAPATALVPLLSLLGSYLLYGALFSQAFVIHPYLFDVLLFTPFTLALFALLPAMIEARTSHRGVATAAVFFLMVWVSMVQLRDYAMWYPAAAVKASPTH
jgi:hypothetical protein